MRLQLLVCAGIVLLAMVCGCTSTGSRGGNPFAQRYRLADEANAMRAANTGVLQLPRELEKAPLATYVVEAGDVLLVQAADIDSPARLPGDQPVLPDGTINLGRYGHVLVAGKTVKQIEEAVQKAVQAQTPNAGGINVRIVSRQSLVYYVIGEVNSPGAFPLNGREAVLDGIMAAGGLTDSASRSNIILSRPSKPCDCRTVLPICLRDIVQLGDTTTNYQLAPGDRIYVPSKTLVETIFGDACDEPLCCGQHTPCSLPRTFCSHGSDQAATDEAGVLNVVVPAGSGKRVEK